MCLHTSMYLPSILFYAFNMRNYLLVLQVLERAVQGDIIPFNSGDLVVGHSSKSIDQVSTQAWINVVRLEFSQSRPVLGPVGEVA